MVVGKNGWRASLFGAHESTQRSRCDFVMADGITDEQRPLSRAVPCYADVDPANVSHIHLAFGSAFDLLDLRALLQCSVLNADGELKSFLRRGDAKGKGARILFAPA